MTGYYKAKCPHCGQIDIVYNEQKTHKCSSCGNRNKMNYNDPSINMGEADNPFSAAFVQVNCPYCGHMDIVPIGEKRHTCSSCSGLYEVISNNGAQMQSQRKSISDFFHNNSPTTKKTEGIVGLIAIAAIIIGILFLCFSGSENSDPTTDRDYSAMHGVRMYLWDNLNDPGSYKEVDWSHCSYDSDKGYYYIRHRYRCKNIFGGIVTENKIFILNKSFQVYDTRDYF